MHPLDLILPCYNPAAGWKEIITQNVNLLQQYLPDTEVFVYLVNDGSTLGVHPEDFHFLKQSLPNLMIITYDKNKGKGYALRQGIQETHHDYCIYTDVDFPYTLESFAQLYRALINPENDVVVGVREEPYYANLAKSRVLISKFLQLLNQYILHLPVTDTQCGLKGFNQKGRELFLRTKINRYLFDLEFMLLAAKNPGIQIKTVPVALRSGIAFQKMKGKLLAMEAISLIKIILTKSFYFLEEYTRKKL